MMHAAPSSGTQKNHESIQAKCAKGIWKAFEVQDKSRRREIVLGYIKNLNEKGGMKASNPHFIRRFEEIEAQALGGQPWESCPINAQLRSLRCHTFLMTHYRSHCRKSSSDFDRSMQKMLFDLCNKFSTLYDAIILSGHETPDAPTEGRVRFNKETIHELEDLGSQVLDLLSTDRYKIMNEASQIEKYNGCTFIWMQFNFRLLCMPPLFISKMMESLVDLPESAKPDMASKDLEKEDNIRFKLNQALKRGLAILERTKIDFEDDASNALEAEQAAKSLYINTLQDEIGALLRQVDVLQDLVKVSKAEVAEMTSEHQLEQERLKRAHEQELTQVKRVSRRRRADLKKFKKDVSGLRENNKGLAEEVAQLRAKYRSLQLEHRKLSESHQQDSMHDWLGAETEAELQASEKERVRLAKCIVQKDEAIDRLTQELSALRIKTKDKFTKERVQWEGALKAQEIDIQELTIQIEELSVHLKASTESQRQLLQENLAQRAALCHAEQQVESQHVKLVQSVGNIKSLNQRLSQAQAMIEQLSVQANYYWSLLSQSVPHSALGALQAQIYGLAEQSHHMSERIERIVEKQSSHEGRQCLTPHFASSQMKQEVTQREILQKQGKHPHKKGP